MKGTIKDIDKDDLANALKSLYTGFKVQDKKEAIETELFRFLIEKKDWFNNPKTFYLMVLNKLEDIIEQCLESTIENCDVTIKEIYLNFDFYECHIRNFIVMKEGHCCCADKSKFIIKSYIDYIKTGEYPIFNKDKYSVPKFGDSQFWIKYIKALTRLLHGKIDDYLFCYKEIFELKKD